MKLTLQEKVALATLLYHSVVIFMAGGMAAPGFFFSIQPLLDAGGLLLLGHALSFRRLGLDRRLQQLLIRRQGCLCGFCIPLTGVRWRCQCSFVSGPRSGLGPCPRCGVGFDALSCPQCGTGHIVAEPDRSPADRQRQQGRRR